jgi:uridine kinase
VVVVEGIHAFRPAVQQRYQLRVFIHADEPTLIAMRACANVKKRGMDVAEAGRHINAELEDFRRYILAGQAAAHIRLSVVPTFDYQVDDA